MKNDLPLPPFCIAFLISSKQVCGFSDLLPEVRFLCTVQDTCIWTKIVARKFTVLLEPAEEGGFIVKCMELPVASEGETKEEALQNIREAIEGYLEIKTKLLQSKNKGEKAEVVVKAPSTRVA
jgi:predicted RNase H-like HicB family nuclease